MKKIFKNRQDAGLLLAAHLNRLPKKDLADALVLAIPRGGVPVGREISKRLEIPFDILIVRKIGHPFHPEYGIGAVTEDNVLWMDPDAIGLSKVSVEQIEEIQRNEIQEVEQRTRKFRSGRSLPNFHGKTIILVDDGLATGVTARAAIMYSKSRGAKKIILAIPICSENTVQKIKSEIDHIICINRPIFFKSVSDYYQSFQQLTDDEVIDLIPHLKKKLSTQDSDRSSNV